MTTTHSLSPAALDQLCDHLANCDDCFDTLFDSLDRLSAILDEPSFTALLEAFDICPEHLCDIEICIDDNDTCQA